MRLTSIIAIAVLTILLSCEKYQDYQKIDENYMDRQYSIKNIIPNKEIFYWRYVETSSNKVVKEVGDKTILLDYEIKEPTHGFFPECMPGFCYSYVVYIDSSGLNYVTDEKLFGEFIGDIDNMSEAILIGKIQNLWIDKENKKGGSYIKTDSGYEMNLLKYEGCPETYESIFFKIGFNGNFTLKSNGVYKTTGDCIMF